jgi:TM2 domain-containing membrane protein YozV
MPSKNSTNEKSKLVLLIISSLGLGFAGIDRFYAGDITMGIIKLFTGGGFGIWAFIDWVLIIVNALTRSREGLFGITKWNDLKNEDLIFYLALIIVILNIALFVVNISVLGTFSISFINTMSKYFK